MSKAKKLLRFLPILLLFALLLCGVLIHNDYGISADEIIQLEGARSNFKFIFADLCEKHGWLQGVTPLPKFYNRYYGYAVFFPTVVFEALNDFQLSNAAVFRVRHLWNFLNYFLAIACFAWLLQKRFKRTLITSAGILSLWLLPRAFAESFYNDRDLILLSWFIISAAAIYAFTVKPSRIRAILCGIALAMAINTRVFAGLLFIPLFLPLPRGKFERKALTRTLLVLLTCVLVWYIITPIVWNDPFGSALKILDNSVGTTQRMAETPDGTIRTLYLGEYVLENDLPWHYLPVWIGVSTPIAYLLLFLAGSVLIVRECIKRRVNSFDLSIFLIFWLSLLAVIILRPQMYNGWRHFYYLYLPLIYLGMLALDAALSIPQPFIRIICPALLAISYIFTGSWMWGNHPYQMVYFNQLVRENASDLFIRDYWYLTASECLDFITENDDDLRLTVWDNNSGIRLIFNAMPVDVQERVFATSYSVGEPGKYLTVNYSGSQGNEFSFPFYKAALHIRVDEMKLASVFERDHSNELFAFDVVENIESNTGQDELMNLYDNNFSTSWKSADAQNDTDELLITFKEPLELYGMTFYQGAYGRGYPDSPVLEYSDDGENWQPLPVDQHFGIDLTFQATTMKQLRIRNAEPADFHWAASEIVFYGFIIS